MLLNMHIKMIIKTISVSFLAAFLLFNSACDFKSADKADTKGESQKNNPDEHTPPKGEEEPDPRRQVPPPPLPPVIKVDDVLVLAKGLVGINNPSTQKIDEFVDKSKAFANTKEKALELLKKEYNGSYYVNLLVDTYLEDKIFDELKRVFKEVDQADVKLALDRPQASGEYPLKALLESTIALKKIETLILFTDYKADGGNLNPEQFSNYINELCQGGAALKLREVYGNINNSKILDWLQVITEQNNWQVVFQCMYGQVDLGDKKFLRTALVKKAAMLAKEAAIPLEVTPVLARTAVKRFINVLISVGPSLSFPIQRHPLI